ncbi:MAG: hypothetical protein M0R74_11740 [Dehalococcoidia bacterium]|nr:hypothetical protein [Dehalococcoidia bacterium]
MPEKELREWAVRLREETDPDSDWVFLCMAEDKEHAIEQAKDHYQPYMNMQIDVIDVYLY